MPFILSRATANNFLSHLCRRKIFVAERKADLILQIETRSSVLRVKMCSRLDVIAKSIIFLLSNNYLRLRNYFLIKLPLHTKR